LRVALIFERVRTFNQFVRGLVHGLHRSSGEEVGTSAGRVRAPAGSRATGTLKGRSPRVVPAGRQLLRRCAGEGRRLPAATRARRTELRLQALHGSPTIHRAAARSVGIAGSLDRRLAGVTLGAGHCCPAALRRSLRGSSAGSRTAPSRHP
jgi:hypothetical protein